MKFNEALKDLRTKKGWGQQEAADKLGIAQGHLSLLESGNREPKKSLVKIICRVYKIAPFILAWMIADEKDVPKNKREIYLKLKPAVDEIINQIIAK